MSEIKQLIIVLCIAVSMISRAYATNGMRVIGVGPVQRAMGGANVALPLDSAASLTNPSGLTELDRRMDIAVTYFDFDVSYKATSTAGMVLQNNTFIGSEASPCFMPAFGVTLPIDDLSTLGFGAYGVCGMGVDYPRNLYNNVTYTEYQYMKFAPAIAHRLDDKISVGAALNLGYAMMEFRAGTPLQQPHNDGDALGVGFTVGALYKVNEKVSLGVAYESKQSFSDFEFSTPAGTDKLRLNQPQSLTTGLALQPANRLRMAFDIAWIDWPQTMGQNRPAYTRNRSGAAPWNMNWGEQLVYKLGFEYDIDETTRLRLGYNYAKNPLDAKRAFENIAFPAIAEHHITGGLAVRLCEKIVLNIGAMYAPNVSFRSANANQFINSAETKMSQYSVDAGITSFF